MENTSTEIRNGHDQSRTRAAINRANAQHSTGPRTEEGKKRSSLNALRHGLTGHVIVMPGEDLAAYDRFAKSFFDEYQPKTPTEQSLVQTTVDITWKLNRATALENNLLVLGATEHESDVNSNHPQVQTALAQAAGYRADSRMFANLNTQTHRLYREREKTIKLLLELQTRRREKEAEDLGAAAKLLDLHKEKGLPYNSADDGFVFATSEIETYIRRKLRKEEADHAHYIRNFKHLPANPDPLAPPSNTSLAALS